MPIDPLSLIRNSARRMVVVPSREVAGVRMVYAIERVGSPAFLRLAMSALALAGQEQQDADEEAVRMLGARTEADRERIAAELAEGKALREQRQQEQLVQSGQLAAIIAQQDELVMAATVAVGIAREDFAGEGLQPASARPEDLCQPLDEDSPKTPKAARDRDYLRPIRWEGPGRADTDTLKIGMIPEEERMLLARSIAEAFGPGREVTTFRHGPPDGSAGGEVGSDVRAAPERPGPRRPGRGRDRSGGAGGGGGVGR
jgi:hypothetical protein